MPEDRSDTSMPPSARGGDTRQRLIEAALDLFGRNGFDGVSTRALAEAAGANVAAISYHFGSKEGLYRAVMEDLVGQLIGRVGEPATAAAHLAGDPEATREQLVAALLRLVERFAITLIPEGPAAAWARFIVREQMDPSPNFDAIFKRVIGPIHHGLAQLVARVKGLPPDSDEARLLVFMILGQVIVFRFGRAAVTRAMGWERIAEKEFAIVKPLLLQQVTAILGVEAKP